ncbi:hypothetical protein [Paraburkholderia sp. MM6662-R1]|uniref:hypothetical protein n=1 Tax=Paraburkholderia sp. MM6662-R1 TaxID=2991066 RepID=UPI003D19A789
MLHKSVFLDIGALSCGCTDHALESLAKAISGEEGDAPDIWAQHESPFVRSLIELFSSRGLLRLEKVRDELNAWLEGKHHTPGTSTPAAPAPLNPARLDAHELALVKIYLENIPPAEFGAADWSLLIDYLVSRYMPFDALQTEAEWLAVRSVYMGKIQANVEKLPVVQADRLLAALPTTLPAARSTFDPPPVVQSVLDYGYARCADNVQAVTESTRHRLKRVIMAHEEQARLGARPPAQALQTQLFDEFATLNRDWRRIAVTEVGDNAGNGLIASLKPGTRVRRIEQYRGACPFCRKINGTVLTVVSPDKKDKDWDTEVWCGKSNIGRSGAKRKRVDDELVERTPAELWSIPAGTVHPHCRGIWTVLEEARPTDDPKFASWLDAHFAKHRKTPEALAQT